MDDSAVRLIDEGRVDLVISIAREYDEHGRPDTYQIRRRAVDTGISLITDLHLARAVVEALRTQSADTLTAVAWESFLSRTPSELL